MGSNDHEERRGKNRRGSVNNAGRLAAFAAGKSDSAKRADWGGADPRWLQAVVVAMCELGGAVTFATSRDGGAYGLTLLLDGDRKTLWFNGDADLDVELETVFRTLEAL